MPHLEHPYEELTGGRFLRGNLHTHTTRSDGNADMQPVVDAYAQRGYDFLMISDHDLPTSPQDYATIDAGGMTLICGSEITQNGPHLLHVNAAERIEPLALRQQVIHDVKASGGFVVFNHINWQETFNHCPIESLRQWIDYTGIEIFNGIATHEQGSAYATNKWDMLLAAGRKIWGFANDDMHNLQRDFALGWNMVYCDTTGTDAIVAAMAAGRFYASTGVTIESIEVSEMRIRIETADAQRIVALRDTGRRLAIADDRVIEIDVPVDATYVRFECWGRGESFAWTQPFFVVRE